MAWSEIDLDKGWWTLPSHRSKGGTEHRIPLSASARAVLQQLRAASTGDYVFPGWRRGQPLINAQKLITRIRPSVPVLPTCASTICAAASRAA